MTKEKKPNKNGKNGKDPKTGKFTAGNPGGGRPKGSRSIAIEVIFKVFEKHGKKDFEKEMIDICKKNPVAYYLKFVQPLQPKSVNLTDDEGNNLTPTFTKQDKIL